jgi:hypothetical protein
MLLIKEEKSMPHSRKEKSHLKPSTAATISLLTATQKTHLPIVASKAPQCFPHRSAEPIHLPLNSSTTECTAGIYQSTHRKLILAALELSNFAKGVGPSGERCSAYFSGTGGPNEHAARELAEAFGLLAPLLYLTQKLLSITTPKEYINFLSLIGLGVYILSRPTTNPIAMATEVLASAFASVPGEVIGEELGKRTASTVSFFTPENTVKATNTLDYTT